MTDKVVIAFTTCPDDAVAARLARVLVDEGLAACVNRLPGISSTYKWEGKLQEDAEVFLLMKTTERQVADLQARLEAEHPYELPEFVVLPVCAGSERYLEWVRQSTGLGK